MSKTGTVVRDFVYLDWERVRSMSAQLLGGVPQDATRESGHDVGARGRVEGVIPLAIKGRGEGDYRYFRTQNETRSLHHYVYSLFEERLREGARSPRSTPASTSAVGGRTVSATGSS